MSSNVVVDATTIASFQSDVSSIKQYLETTQYSYSGRNQTTASSIPLIPSDVTNSISIFQSTTKVTVSSNPVTSIVITPPNPFKNLPIVSATVECSNPPGAMVAVLTNIDTVSNAMTFSIYTFGTITTIDAFLHVTAISYE